MTEREKIKALSGEEYRLYAYVRTFVNEHQVAWNITREKIEKELDLSYVTVYKHLKSLVHKGYIEYDGRKKKIKVLL